MTALRNIAKETETARQFVGTTIGGRYKLERFIAQGGYAAVYRATDMHVRASVAVKVARAETDREGARRFANEVRICEALPPHPCIARASDHGTIGEGSPFEGKPYLVTELIEGKPLSECIASSGDYPIDDVVRIACDMLDALSFLHRRGVVHRDVKPENIMIRADGSATLIDFGLAFAKGNDTIPRSPNLTQALEVVGTVLYMAPEQVGGIVRPQPSFDVYALGATLYEALCKHAPFFYADRREIMRLKTTEPVHPLARVRRDAPEALTSLVHSMLTRDPNERPTATELRGQVRGMGTKPEEPPAPASIARDIAPAPAVVPPRAVTPSPPAAALEPMPASSRTTSTRRKAIAYAVLILSIAVLSISIGSMIERPKAERAATMFAFRFPTLEPKHVEPVAPEHIEPPQRVEPPEHVEPPQRVDKPKRTRPHKRDPKPDQAEPTTPDPPRDDGACAKARSSAKRAFKSGRHPEALRHTKDLACWNGHEKARLNLRVLSLYELGRYSACAREGKGSSDPDTLTYAKICDAKK